MGASTEWNAWLSTKESRPEVGRDIEILVDGYYPGDQFLIRRGQMTRFKLAGEDTVAFHEYTIWKGKPSLCLANAEYWRYLSADPLPDLPWVSGTSIAACDEYDSWSKAA